MVTMQITNPKAIATLGEKIYTDKYREAYEQDHPGKFVAIDISTEEAFVGNTAEAALDAAQTASPTGVFHLIKVGSPGAFRVSYASNGHLDWIFG